MPLNLPKKAAALLLALCVGTALFGCSAPAASSSSGSSGTSSSASSSSSAATAPETFTLPAVFSQSMNPLTTSCMQNLVLWPLLFDSLAQTDASFTAQKGLATDISSSGTTVRVTLRSGVKFSDGSTLSAADVVYSYNLVKNTPASYFYSNVANIASVTGSGTTVVFTLNAPDALAANLLNIPIIKSGSDVTAAADVNYPNKPPVGSGPYTLSMAAVGSTMTLNKSWYGGTGSFGFQTIALYNIHNSNAIASSLKIGEINYLFTDYGQGETAVANMDTKAVNLNRMVFLGVNAAHAGVSDAHVRKAVSLLINRSSLVTDAFSTQALGTDLPYNPDWAGGAQPAKEALLTQADKADAELRQAGYTAGGAGGAYTKTGGAALTLTLLYNSDNSRMTAAAKAISQTLTKAGIGVTLSGQTFDAYTAALQAGSYDLYLGDIALTDDMDLSPLLAAGGAAAYGVPANSATLTAFNAWRAGGALSDLTAAFESETPFIPLCFRTGTVSFTPGLSGTVTPTARNIFYGIAGWHY